METKPQHYKMNKNQSLLLCFANIFFYSDEYLVTSSRIIVKPYSGINFQISLCNFRNGAIKKLVKIFKSTIIFLEWKEIHTEF